MVQPVLSDLWLRSTESTTSSLSRGASSQHVMALPGSFPPAYHSHPSFLASTLKDLSTILRTYPACSGLYAIIRAYNAFPLLPTLTQYFLPGKPDISLRNCHLFDILFKQIIISSLGCECSLAVISLHP